MSKTNVKQDLNIQRIGTTLPQEEPLKPTNIVPSSGTKPLYLILVEDPSSKSKFKVYGTSKPDRTTSYVEITGFDLTKAHVDNLRTYEDAIELSKQGKLEIVNMVFPWNRIISIKNVSYGYKVKSA